MKKTFCEAGVSELRRCFAGRQDGFPERPTQPSLARKWSRVGGIQGTISISSSQTQVFDAIAQVSGNRQHFAGEVDSADREGFLSGRICESAMDVNG
ncbi:hypothetical protein NZK35_09390 [Stieleria sp. ICT_E10.1]|uniref:hypothetical protein n=1 Tax=Stieleria sedimenti TaxID=2976331 RepID=UPI00218089D7|nr:hypothetical protein [Stieleria sedimenti]MCS7466856.1 hypothetical protein [Stieleria sedimenti]